MGQPVRSGYVMAKGLFMCHKCYEAFPKKHIRNDVCFGCRVASHRRGETDEGEDRTVSSRGDR